MKEHYKELFKNNFAVILSAVLFVIIFVTGYEFYKAVTLMLEFIVIMEVWKMISDFIKHQMVRLTIVVNVFIIFLIRDVVILASKPDKDYADISFMLMVIFIFFIFRILAIKFSPNS